MNDLFIIKVKIFMLVRWSYRSPPPKFCQLLNLGCLSYFDYTVQSLYSTHIFGINFLSYFDYTVQSLYITHTFGIIFGATPNHTPLQCKCSIKMSIKLGTSTLL